MPVNFQITVMLLNVSSVKDWSVIFIINPSIRGLINYREKRGTLFKSNANKSSLDEMNRRDISMLPLTYLHYLGTCAFRISSLLEEMVTNRRGGGGDHFQCFVDRSMRTEFLFTSESNYSVCLRSVMIDYNMNTVIESER